MKCPQCNADGCEALTEEVDIGVGIQSYVWGYECKDCGQIPVCGECGGVVNHSKICSAYVENF